MPGSALAHDAFVFDSDEEFLANGVPFLADAVDSGEGAVAVTSPEKIELLRTDLGGLADGVQFVDATDRYQRAIDTIAEYELMVKGFEAAGVSFRVLGQVEFGATPEQHSEWTRYESVINRVFERAPGWVVCSYDRRDLPEAIVDDALLTHPFLYEWGVRRPSPSYVPPERFVPSRALPLPGTSEIPLRVLDVDASNLATARGAVAALAQRRGLAGERVPELAMALNELVTNAVVHGGGRAMVRLWVTAEAFTCEVSDWGPGVDDPLLGYRPPDPLGLGGRGLWLARQLFDRVELMPSPSSGLTVRATARI